MSKQLNQFIGSYSLTKTLREKLIPVGKTQEHFLESKILDRDKERAEAYSVVKELIDECHKYLINESLKADNVDFDWLPLKEAIETCRKDGSDENKKNLENKQEEMRKFISKKLKNNDGYDCLNAPTPDKLLKDGDFLKKVLGEEHGKEKEQKLFKGFASYFKGFQENRRNIYSSDAISTGVPYRVVNDNFPKFLSDIEVFGNLKTLCPEVLKDAEQELMSFLEGLTLDDVFTVGFYNNVLNQGGIDFFNQIIGGVALAEGEKKLRGINEFANLYRQQHPELKTNRKGVTMVPLFKQILSDRETASFIPQAIGSDEELIGIIKQFHQNITCAEVDGAQVNIIRSLCELLCSVNDYDVRHVFVCGKSLTNISKAVYDNWGYVSEKLREKATLEYGTSTKTALQKIDSYLNRDAYSFEELSRAKVDVTSFFADCEKLAEDIECNYVLFESNVVPGSQTKLIEDAGRIEIVKNMLDAYMQLLHKAKLLAVSDELELDSSFYNVFFTYYNRLNLIIPLFTKVRNYLTQNPYEVKKFKLKFDIPTLAAGWDMNKEITNASIILRCDGKYYLGILSKDCRKSWGKVWPSNGKCYQKMSYKQMALPMGFGAFVRKCSGTAEMLGWSCPPACENEEKKIIIKNEEAKDILPELIDCYKEFLNVYEKDGFKYKDFKFVFKDSTEYEDLNQFFEDVKSQSFILSFNDVSASYIDKLVDEGKMYLFQIYNKDYAEGAHGAKNLHTLYWENLFSEENLHNLVLKLNGDAELFYREGSIKKPVAHRVGEKMLNKRDKSGMPIPNRIYKELYGFYNGKNKKDELSKEAKDYLDNVVVKDVTHEIVKDRRYMQPHFEFHVPITLNCNAQGSGKINSRVKEYLKDNPDVNIIGLDRGERHLVYLTLINQKGEILKQKTFNIVNKMNYQAMLTQREKERDLARKSWQTIGNIKDLKEGFLSAVVHEITSMMVEYNAIVVMEDLNFGFKRGRFKVEKQVYQKFEKMLIDKLNYLPFKNLKADESGGILRGYQFAEEFKSFKKMTKQNGFLFYIPAAYTSKIDPVSGFVNIFNLNDITSVSDKKEFFSKFDAIRFVSEEEGFEFTFDYGNFKTYQTDYKRCWTISTYGKRIVMKDVNGHKQMEAFYPTKALMKAFHEAGFSLQPGMDVKAVLDVIEPSRASSPFFGTMFDVFKKSLQMRNSNAATEEDYILSPVKVNGRYFNSNDEANKGKDSNGNWISRLPVDADANGAYHIALKGLYTLLHPTDKLEHAKWLEFMQTKPYRDE